jgi:hemolysin activation/secretion protein
LALALACLSNNLLAAPPDAGGSLRDIEQRPLESPRIPASAPYRIEAPAPEPAAADPTAFRVDDLRFEGNTAISTEELRGLIVPHLGTMQNLSTLRALIDRLTRHYRLRGYPLARAYLPAQEIRSGIVRVTILEGRYGNVAMDNLSALTDEMLSHRLDTLRDGEIVAGTPLESTLLRLSDLPGIQVQSTLRPGASVGTSDLMVQVTPGKRIEGGIEFDNFGNYYSGEHRLGGNVRLNNPFGAGDALSLRALVSDASMHYGRLAYQLPVGARGATAGAAWSDTRYRLGKTFSPLDAHGSAQVASAWLLHPVVRSVAFNLYGRLQFDDKRLEDRVDSTATVTGKRNRLWIASLGGDFVDSFGGGGTNRFEALIGSGRLAFDSAAAAAIDAVSARSAGGYERINLGFTRLQSLTGRLSLLLAYNGQFARKNLDASEKLGLGGIGAVRAYPVGEAAADEGHIVNAELRFGIAPDWHVGAFLDAGRGRINRKPWVADQNIRELSGYGLNTTWLPARDWSVNAQLAWRGSRDAPTAAPDRTPRLWAQLAWRF